MNRVPMILGLSLVLACGGPDDGSTSPADSDSTGGDTPLSLDQLSLEPATVGEPYTAWLDATGGEPPYTWEITAGGLPPGLLLNPAGAISGVVEEARTVALSLQVTDDAGDVASVDAELVAAWAVDMLPCGGESSGSFAVAATSEYGDVVDWEADEGLAWLRVPLPPPDTTRVELAVSAPGDSYAWLGEPGIPVGHETLTDYRQRWVGWGEQVVVDLETDPDLESYAAVGQPMTVLLASEVPGNWTATTTCTDGPILTNLSPYPVEAGQALAINYSVSGISEGLDFSIDGELPDWAELDPATGKITGIAQEPGAWEYTVEVQTADGRTRQEQSGFGVYQIEELACGDSTELSFDADAYDGPLTSYYDPREFRVLRIPLSPELSSVQLDVSGESGIASLVDPGSSYRFVGDWQAGYFYNDNPVQLAISPSSHPPLSRFRQVDGAVYAVITSYFETWSDPVRVAATCDSAPRLATPSLPVLEVGVDEEFQLEGTGGAPPYSFSMVDPPDGVSLSPDGVLSSDGSAAGAWTPELILSDSDGVARSEVLDLYAGADAACEGRPRLRCGDTLSSAVEGSWYSDPEAGSELYCLVHDHDEIEQMVLTLSVDADSWVLLSAGAPGGRIDDLLYGGEVLTLQWAEDDQTVAAVLRSHSSPDLDPWRDRVMPVAVLGWADASFDLSLSCD